MKDPADKKKWIVDEEAAEIVKRIFDLCVAGKGPMQIAKALTAGKVLTVKVNFKTYSKSHKLKKRLQNAPENYRIFPDTQPAIINEKVWERVQELRANKRRPAKQVQRPPAAENPDYLELRRGIEAGRGQADH